MGEFDGLVAAVTGGASGIGAATAQLLAAKGAHVLALDVTPKVDAPLVGVRCDVSDDSEVREAMELVRDEFGRLDVLVNNAGIGAQGDITANDDTEWHRVLDVNVIGIARLSRAALGLLRRSEHASIVNVCSIAGLAGLPQRALYSASKGAVHALTLAMAADHVGEGIRVNAVAPGTVDTPWVQRLLERAEDQEAERAALEARQPTGRLVSADEVAHAIAYLASPAASATTGTVLTADHGMSGLRMPGASAR